MNPDNAWTTRLTAAAGTSLAGPYSPGTVMRSSPAKAVYTPKGFFQHAASLPQAFAHWEIFSTAASRRSKGSVSVPLRRVALSRPLSVVALVGHYPTNKLIDHRPLPERLRHEVGAFTQEESHLLRPSGISVPFGSFSLSRGQVTNVLRTRLPLFRLPCSHRNRSTCMP